MSSLANYKQRSGLLYGFFAGLALALATWGMDAFLLWQVQAVFPWARFLVGGGVTLVVFMLAGWLAIVSQNALLAALIWLGASLVPANLVTPLSFGGWPVLVTWLEPELASRLVNFSIESPDALGGVFMAILGVAALIAGALEITLVEQTMLSSAAGAMLGPIVLVSLVFMAAGLMVDNALHTKLREPLLNLDETIRFVATNDLSQVDKATARAMHVAAFKVVGTRCKPHRLVVASYNPTFEQVDVWVDFDGTWAYCYTVSSQVVNCTLNP